MAGPAVALNALQTFNSILDNFFLSYVSSNALTAVGASVSFVFLLISVSMALGTATTAIVSRAFGAGVHDEYREANNKCLSLAFWVGVALLALAWPTSVWVSHVLVTESQTEARELFVLYSRLVAVSIPAICVIQSLAGALRGIGDARSPMFISGFQILLHIALNTVLVLPSRPVAGIVLPGLGLGLKGAGIAMATSAWISAIAYLAWCARTPLGRASVLHIPSLDWVRRIVRIAFPASMMSLVRVTSLAAFTVVLKNSFDAAAAQAALRPGFSIEAFAFMPAFGLSISAAALVGQSLGMGRPDRAELLGWTAAIQGAIVSACVSLLLFVFAGPIAHAVVPGNAAVAEVAAHYTRYIASTEILFAFAMVLIGAMQGAGDTRRPLWLSLICLWGVRVPLAAVLALPAVSLAGISVKGFNMGSNGAWLSMAVTQALQGVYAIGLFKSGKWKQEKV